MINLSYISEECSKKSTIPELELIKLNNFRDDSKTFMYSFTASYIEKGAKKRKKVTRCLVYPSIGMEENIKNLKRYYRILDD